MELQVGSTYKSPFKGRDFTVVAITDEDDHTFTLDVRWIDRDTGERELGTFVTLKSDVPKWTKVDHV